MKAVWRLPVKAYSRHKLRRPLNPVAADARRIPRRGAGPRHHDASGAPNTVGQFQSRTDHEPSRCSALQRQGQALIANLKSGCRKSLIARSLALRQIHSRISQFTSSGFQPPSRTDAEKCSRVWRGSRFTSSGLPSSSDFGAISQRS